ncbi:TadE-like protein [Hasllibacter halocynthiae]|uniref:TadE-like protein n=1 Tax=Hasllibacter halocynthiae TaxID=595589 RepID=A0A2T0X746_9RHOB|nr:TadE/TadG family type IV pilus assembly protein [Hasllibacter halocynthiae]PRY94715.1 TadE-like protein [Hasllibacter halocynthiae]
MIRVIRRLARAARREDGFMAMEFAILMPAMLLFLCFGIEVGTLMARSAMLDRAVDIASRDLRLGTVSPLSYDEFRESICDKVAIIGDCQSSLIVEVVDFRDVDAGTWRSTSVCAARGGADLVPADSVTYAPGFQNTIKLVRACMPIDSFFPGAGPLALLPRDANGDFRIVSINAFVHEPELNP